jgi:tetratricopeptide (TPR) repeat protein
MKNLSIFSITLVALTTLSGVGCSRFMTSERLLPKVREDGDRAFARGDYVTARADYGEYVNRMPGDPKVRSLWAKTLIETGDEIAAVDHAQIAYSTDPTNEAFIETYADALLSANRKGMMFDLLKGAATECGRVNDYDRLGRFSLRAGDADSAEEAFILAAKLDRGNTVEPQLALANFYQDIGDKTKELERLRMASFLDPTNKEIADRIRALGQIPGPSFALQPSEWE